MYTITSITQAKKNADRVNIFLNDEFWVGLSKAELLGFALFKGKEIDEGIKSQIEKSSEYTKLLQKVIDYAMLRPRSEKEVRDYLVFRRKISDDESAKLLEYLKSKLILSDESFAEWFIKTRLDSGVHGENKIRAELQKKGVKKSIVDEVLASFKSSENYTNSETEKVETYVKKILKTVKYKDKFDLKRKVFSRLAGRGFGYEVIERVWKSLDERS
jgi:regulatory protein